MRNRTLYAQTVTHLSPHRNPNPKSFPWPTYKHPVPDPESKNLAKKQLRPSQSKGKHDERQQKSHRRKNLLASRKRSRPRKRKQQLITSLCLKTAWLLTLPTLTAHIHVTTTVSISQYICRAHLIPRQRYPTRICPQSRGNR